MDELDELLNQLSDFTHGLSDSNEQVNKSQSSRERLEKVDSLQNDDER